MTTEDFIIDLFCRIDDQMKDVAKHSQAHLWPSEVVTVGVLFGLKAPDYPQIYRPVRLDQAALAANLKGITLFHTQVLALPLSTTALNAVSA